jgi:hypothetical protein
VAGGGLVSQAAGLLTDVVMPKLNGRQLVEARPEQSLLLRFGVDDSA